MSKRYSRGSEWRLWDLHVHTPASFHWNGERFGNDSQRNTALVDQMIGAFNESLPEVFSIMDYWDFEGWFALKNRIAQEGAPPLRKTIFPGIELRLSAPMDGRLNAHVIFSNTIEDQHLRNFLSALRLELTNQPLSSHALIEYARQLSPEKLKNHGFTKDEVVRDNAKAYDAGCATAEIKTDSYKKAIASVPKGLAIGFMPFSTNDGLTSIRRIDHYAYVLSLFEHSPIFETRAYDEWAAFAGIKTKGNEKWFDSFQQALKNVPRLAVSGSDSHQFRGLLGDNNKRGYGDFPSGKKTWIKADPTWFGLLQALKEPGNRSFLGETPPKLDHVGQNKTYYIDTIRVSKATDSTLLEEWLDGCSLDLNTDLVAIIGNKGSGKSALADIVALLGNTQQSAYFSFLKPDRFRGRSGEPAHHFRGTMQWLAGSVTEALLSDDPTPDKVELVRYIPQGRFEALCNDHVSQKSDAFEKELRSVIFSHVEDSVRLKALNFDQLIEQQESSLLAKLSHLRRTLSTLNAQIVRIEDQLNPIEKRRIDEKLKMKSHQLAEHYNLQPAAVAEPSGEVTQSQAAANERLERVSVAISEQKDKVLETTAARMLVAEKRAALQRIKTRLAVLESEVADFKNDTLSDFESSGIRVEEILTFEIHASRLDGECRQAATTESELERLASELQSTALELESENARLSEELNEPQREYQQYLVRKRDWQAVLAELEGTESEPESKLGLEARAAQIRDLPEKLQEKKEERIAIVRSIFEVLEKQRSIRALLFSPLQQLIEENTWIGDEYQIQFQANLQGSPTRIAAQLFDLIKQNTGQLRGDEESVAAVKSRFGSYGVDTVEGAVGFVQDIGQLLEESSQRTKETVPGVRSLLRVNKTPEEVYDYIYGLSYLEPRYTIIFQETRIEQLSPGQRGALLLIFYLLVDKGRNPIILDQPEENLDNETVVGLLVPVLNEAKKWRQIFMVTHNPNLAVVCDAEQIIHAKFDRKLGAKISYTSGSIEDGALNRAVVDILEGTKRAFDNRGRKYH